MFSIILASSDASFSSMQLLMMLLILSSAVSFVEAFAYFYSDLADDFLAQKQGGTRNQWIRPIGEAMMGVKFLLTAAESHMTGKWVSL